MRYELAATTFVFLGGRFAIHWHQKVSKWLPPGGHVEEDELPHHAAVREVLEELGVDCKLVMSNQPDLGIDTVPLPIAILVEDIDDCHKHVDMIYVATTEAEKINDGFSWVTIGEAEAMGAPVDVTRLAKIGLDLINSCVLP
jgi:8-oxo-dGTP pyrophosphatase MutT (NUDIX family)